MDKKQLFYMALLAEGISAREFADRHGVTDSAIYKVLHGRSTSARISEAIDAYIREHRHAIMLSMADAA